MAHCPFHDERTPSFTVWEDHAHCYGCGWHGGAAKYVMARQQCDLPRALEILRGRGIAPPQIGKLKAENRNRNEKPDLPELCPLNQDGITSLAKLRCLSPAGIRLAVKSGVLFGARWMRHQSWVITDASRNVAQFRRFDGKEYELHGRPVKAITKGSPSWPVGAANLKTEKLKSESRNVIMLEGGPDLIAAYQLLSSVFKIGKEFRSPEFTPVAMLGSANSISPEALALFDGKRVRILRHDDEAGQRGAEKWTEQLASAGAAVATCCFSRLQSQKQMVEALFDFGF